MPSSRPNAVREVLPASLVAELDRVRPLAYGRAEAAAARSTHAGPQAPGPDAIPLDFEGEWF